MASNSKAKLMIVAVEPVWSGPPDEHMEGGGPRDGPNICSNGRQGQQKATQVGIGFHQ